MLDVDALCINSAVTMDDQPNSYVQWIADAHGNPQDLRILSDELREGAGLYGVALEIDHAPPRLRLASKETDTMQDHKQVGARLRSQVFLANGALAVLHGAGPVRLHGNLEGVRRDGTRHRFVFLEPVAFALVGGTMRFLVTPAQRGPSRLEQWIAVGSRNDFVADALGFFSREAGWFDLYKALEEIAADHKENGGRAAIWGNGWSTKEQVVRFAMSAHHHRHANSPLPSDPMDLAEARQWLVDVMTKWIESKSHDSR